MTPDERSLLTSFLSDLAQTPNVAKDPEADRMISDAVRSNPDAVYLLVQHAILADQTLHATQAQLQELQSPSPEPPPSFLPARNPGYVQSAQPAVALGRPTGRAHSVQPLRRQQRARRFPAAAGAMAAGVAARDFLAQGVSNIFSPRC